MKLLFLVTEDWYFCSHRFPIARAARDAGHEIVVATRVDAHENAIREEGFRLIPLKMRRRNKNPIRELAAVLEIMNIYRRERPDIVHHVALKPVLYGALAARVTGVTAIVNALAGLGYVFSSTQSQARILKLFVRAAFRVLLNRQNSVVLLQNPDDRRMLVESKTIFPEYTALIRGSGVDIQRFRSSPEQGDGIVMVTLVARMLRDKGVLEFVEASRLLIQQGVQFRAVLVGMPDPENPTSIPVSQLESWQAEKLIEWWGYQDDIPTLFSRSHVVCLPSYREGLPKVLIEAAACGRAIVTTDTPGCREIVCHGENGLLVPARDSQVLADALKTLIENPAMRIRMGARGREVAVAEFSEEKVIEQTLSLYRELLS